MVEATHFCDAMGIPLELMEPRDEYMHGWGRDCLDARKIICTWALTVLDSEQQPCTFYFDLVPGKSLLVVGLDVGRYSKTVNLTDDHHIKIKRPKDQTTFRFTTYTSPDSIDKPECIRLRSKLLPRPFKSISSMLSNLHPMVRDNPHTFAKKIHRYTHVHPDQLKDICQDAAILNKALADSIDHTSSACEICIQHGRPLPFKKISLTHVNEAFNEEVQVDFTFIVIYRQGGADGTHRTRIQYKLLVFTETGTKFTECVVVEHRNAATIVSAYDTAWLARHGASKFLSADNEYHRRVLTVYIGSQGITFKARPTRRHNKLGIVERKNQTLKLIIERLVMEHTSAPIETLVARGTFMCNMFAGSQTLSSFQLVRGYQPSILGILPTYATQDLLDAHTQQIATQALQRVLCSRSPNVPTPGMFKKGDTVWVWYASSKNNEDNQWIRTVVVDTHRHYLEVRRIKDGRPCRGVTMKPAYEDVRIAPEQELAQSLMECSLEPAIDSDDSAGRGVPAHGISSMIATTATKKGPAEDIGKYADVSDDHKSLATRLQSERARILDEIYNEVGSQQVTRHKLDFASPWILDQAFEKEYDSNWADAFEQVPEHDVPSNANVITSHSVDKVKTAEDGERTFKARIVPHGNRDNEKEYIRKDSSTAQLSIIRLLLFLVTFLGFRLATADIKGAYLQSGPISRDIYVRPPKEWYSKPERKRGTLWKLKKLPYGIVEAGRQCQKIIESWMMNEGEVDRVLGISQLFMKRDKTGNIVLLIAKVTDDFSIGGKAAYIQDFLDKLGSRFTIGQIVTDSHFHFDRCEIEQDREGNICMSIIRYIDRLKYLEISRTRQKQVTHTATDAEQKECRALAGTLLYLGNGVLPQASLVVSLMQQRICHLRVQHFIDANKMLKELSQLKPILLFKRPRNVMDVTYCTFSDASHPQERDYGQSGIVSGLRIQHTIPLVRSFIQWTGLATSKLALAILPMVPKFWLLRPPMIEATSTRRLWDPSSHT